MSQTGVLLTQSIQAGTLMGVDARHNIEKLNQFLAGVERRALKMAEIAVGNRDDALDIVQDAMMKLAEKYSHRTHSEWSPLFQRILQSKIRDWYRRSAVRKRLFYWLDRNQKNPDVQSDIFDTVADGNSVDPQRRAGIDEFTPALINALQGLPLRQQQAFLLRAWEGLDVKQTARAMSCSEGSVKTHYHRATKTLQALLGQYYGD